MVENRSKIGFGPKWSKVHRSIEFWRANEKRLNKSRRNIVCQSNVEQIEGTAIVVYCLSAVRMREKLISMQEIDVLFVI